MFGLYWHFHRYEFFLRPIHETDKFFNEIPFAKVVSSGLYTLQQSQTLSHADVASYQTRPYLLPYAVHAHASEPDTVCKRPMGLRSIVRKLSHVPESRVGCTMLVAGYTLPPLAIHVMSTVTPSLYGPSM